MSTNKKILRVSTYRASEARRKRFVAEFLIDHNGARAAVAAGYSKHSAKQGAFQLLSKPRIKALIAEKEKEALAKSELSAQDVLEVIRRNVKRDLSEFVRADGKFKALTELSPEQLRCIDKVVRTPDGKFTYRIEGLEKWVEMAAKHFKLLTDRVELIDHRDVEDKLIEARERALEAGHGKKKPEGRKRK